jgi:hypothetical protein
MVQPWQDLGERGLSVAQSSEQAPFISEIVDSRYGLMRVRQRSAKTCGFSTFFYRNMNIMELRE